MAERKIIKWFILLSFILTGCATSPQIKTLSLKQMEYFDFAIEAVSLQSEALILASEKVINQSGEKIDLEQNNVMDRNAEVMLTDTTNDEKVKLVKKILLDVAETAKEAVVAKAKLDHDLMVIKEKTQELKSYLIKMKEVHQALDAYVQSAKAGEKVVNDVLNQPSIKALLSTIDKLIPKVQSGIKEIQALINKI